MKSSWHLPARVYERNSVYVFTSFSLFHVVDRSPAQSRVGLSRQVPEPDDFVNCRAVHAEGALSQGDRQRVGERESDAERFVFLRHGGKEL